MQIDLHSFMQTGRQTSWQTDIKLDSFPFSQIDRQMLDQIEQCHCLQLTRVRATSSIGARAKVPWNRGTQSTQSTGPSFFLSFCFSATNSPFTEQWGYLAACSNILQYAWVVNLIGILTVTGPTDWHTKKQGKKQLQPHRATAPLTPVSSQALLQANSPANSLSVRFHTDFIKPVHGPCASRQSVSTGSRDLGLFWSRRVAGRACFSRL